MQLQKIPLASTNSFNKLFLDYLGGKPELEKFYNHLPTIKNFKQQIELKKFDSDKRNALQTALQSQYANIEVPSAAQSSLELLTDDKTFTITTGHQLNIFTGPLYFHYKIISVINICKALKAQYADYNFVPCYWMATEDHDFDEISHVMVDGKKYSWETDQQGAVGRFDPGGLLQLVKDIPGSNELFKEAYGDQQSLAQAVRYYVNALYGVEGLLVIDGDDQSLKAQFAQVAEDDIFNNSTNNLATEASKELEALGYKTQVFPRKINFFYLDDGIRGRLATEGDDFEVIDSDLKLTTDKLREMLKSAPEKLSPNVLLRPMYQETIMPNLAYIGGPAEVCYWLQLKSSFDHYNIPFPIVMPRNFGLIVDKPTYRKWQKTNVSVEEFFLDLDAIKANYVHSNTEKDLRLQDQLKDFEEQFTHIEAQAKRIDLTLEPMVNAEFKRLQKSIHKIEKKLLRAEKKNYETELRQIAEVKTSLFPGGLQERKDNFLSFYYENPEILNQWLTHFDPFDFSFHILLEDD